jgi:hypothetical protein
MILYSRLLIALLAWGALSFGAVYAWAYWPLAMAGAGIGVWAIVRTRAWKEPRPRALMLALGGIAAALVVQLVPLPYGWFRDLNPAGDRLLTQLEFGWAAHPPPWHSLSVAPQGTLTALLLFAALGLLLIGLSRAVSYMPLGWLVRQLWIFGAVLAVFGIVQRAVAGASDFAVYGFWHPSQTAAPFGPFINRNHFAGWMIMVLPLALAQAGASLQSARGPFGRDAGAWFRWLGTPDASRFVFAGVAILIMATALVLTGSRSGLLGLLVAMATLAMLGARRVHTWPRRVLPAAAFVSVVVVAVGWAGVARVAARFDRASVELSERVVLLALPVLATLAVLVGSIRHRLRGSDSAGAAWLRAGAIAGLAGIATQSLLEFSLQMPGNAALFVFLMAIALHRPSTTTTDAYRI